MPSPPIVVLGMHRSGTSLLTQCLEDLGLFTGWKKEINFEALFFLKLNEWIFSQANASWDNPYNMQYIDNYFRYNIIRYLDFHQKSIRRILFLGALKTFQHPDIRSLNIPWGWKDPRNTFTLDLWVQVFPGLKAIHIYRNPVDVAVSLKYREEQTRKAYRQTFGEFRKAFSLKRLCLTSSPRIFDLMEGIKLWEIYTQQAISLDKLLDGQIIHICYEDFLLEPLSHLRRIADFAGLTPTEKQLENSAKRVNPSRRYAFTKKEELVKIYNLIKKNGLVKKLKYHDISPAI